MYLVWSALLWANVTYSASLVELSVMYVNEIKYLWPTAAYTIRCLFDSLTVLSFIYLFIYLGEDSNLETFDFFQLSSAHELPWAT